MGEFERAVVARRMVGSLAVDLILGDDGFTAPLDVDVHTDQGEVLHGTFLTVEMIAAQMARYSRSGECAGGLYFWCSSPVVVSELSELVVLKVIADLDRSGELRSALEASFPEVSEDHGTIL